MHSCNRSKMYLKWSRMPSWFHVATHLLLNLCILTSDWSGHEFLIGWNRYWAVIFENKNIPHGPRYGFLDKNNEWQLHEQTSTSRRNHVYMCSGGGWRPWWVKTQSDLTIEYLSRVHASLSCLQHTVLGHRGTHGPESPLIDYLIISCHASPNTIDCLFLHICSM